jgi:hypothetical protein
MEKNTKYCLFLDDVRMPKDVYEYTNNPIYLLDNWIIVRNYYAFITLTQNMGIAAGYSFDHDLADEHYDKQIVKGQTYEQIYEMFNEKTGYHCAEWLIYYCIDNKKELPATILIHSMNPAGSLNIKSLFDTYYKSLKIKSS